MLVFITYFSILLIMLVAALRRPPVALALLLCTYGFEQWAQSNHIFFTQNATFTNYTVGLVVILAIVVDLVRRGRTFSGYPVVGWLVVALFAYAFISTLWAPERAHSLDVWIKYWPYIFVFVGLSPFLVNGREDLRTALMALMPLGTVLTVLLLSSAWEDRKVVLMTAQGFELGNPLAIGQMAGYVAISAILLNFKGRVNMWKWVRWIVVAACFVLAVKSGSRGQFLFTVIAAFLFLPLSRPIENIRAFGALTIALILLGVLAEFARLMYSADIVGSRWDSVQLTRDIDVRVDSAAGLLKAWWSSPSTLLFGLGNSASYDPVLEGFYVHVVAVEVLCEEGLIGAALFVGIVVGTFVSLRRSYRIVKGDAEARGALGAMGALYLFELLLSFKQGSMLGSPLLFGFAVMIARYERCLFDKTTKSNVSGTGEHSSQQSNCVLARKSTKVMPSSPTKLHASGLKSDS